MGSGPSSSSGSWKTSPGVASHKRAKVIMTTALADKATVLEAIQAQCDYFLVKPIHKRALLDELRRLGLIAA